MKLDLGSKHTIDKLVLVGRRDCCPEQSSNWTIRIGSTGTESDPVCKDEVDASGGRPKHVFCKKGGPTSGQWVSIWSGTWMVLCNAPWVAARLAPMPHTRSKLGVEVGRRRTSSQSVRLWQMTHGSL